MSNNKAKQIRNLFSDSEEEDLFAKTPEQLVSNNKLSGSAAREQLSFLSPTNSLDQIMDDTNRNSIDEELQSGQKQK